MEVVARAPSDDLLEAIDHGFSQIAAASAEILRAVAEYDRRKLWRRDGATSMTSWLAARYALAWGTAREWVRVARAVRKLPKIAHAYRSGRLSWDQLRPLTRFATLETDQEWALRAPGASVASLWREAARHQRVSVREAEDAHRRRYLAMWRDPERPVVYLDGALGAEQGAALEAALHRRAEGVVLADGPDDPAGARLADALVELATASGDGQPAPPTLVVHADARVLTGPEGTEGPWLAETEGGHRLPSEAVRRLACDGRVEWVLESGGPAGGDRQAGPGGPRAGGPGASAPGRGGLPVPRMCPPAVAPCPPPGPLGRRGSHRPGQPGAAVRGPSPPDPRGRVEGHRPSRRGPSVPRPRGVAVTYRAPKGGTSQRGSGLLAAGAVSSVHGVTGATTCMTPSIPEWNLQKNS